MFDCSFFLVSLFFHVQLSFYADTSLVYGQLVLSKCFMLFVQHIMKLRG